MISNVEAMIVPQLLAEMDGVESRCLRRDHQRISRADMIVRLYCVDPLDVRIRGSRPDRGGASALLADAPGGIHVERFEVSTRGSGRHGERAVDALYARE